jgi:pimeloyl-ACP methyl ester carboxylesterase
VRRGRQGYAHDDVGWCRLQALLPAPLRLQTQYTPREEWLPVGRFTVHLDRYGPAGVHGAGGNGRLLACYGQIAAVAGSAVVAPDLPGYGVARQPGKRRLVYEDRRDTLCEVLRAEQQQAPGRPIVVFGLSVGGMLPYDAMARTRIPGAAAGHHAAGADHAGRTPADAAIPGARLVVAVVVAGGPCDLCAAGDLCAGRRTWRPSPTIRRSPGCWPATGGPGADGCPADGAVASCAPSSRRRRRTSTPTRSPSRIPARTGGPRRRCRCRSCGA